MKIQKKKRRERKTGIGIAIEIGTEIGIKTRVETKTGPEQIKTGKRIAKEIRIRTGIETKTKKEIKTRIGTKRGIRIETKTGIKTKRRTKRRIKIRTKTRIRTDREDIARDLRIRTAPLDATARGKRDVEKNETKTGPVLETEAKRAVEISRQNIGTFLRPASSTSHPHSIRQCKPPDRYRPHYLQRPVPHPCL